ncbi:hypothetical protein SAMN05192555_1362 [Franzmannia pantelleriensis]|uniref:Uncharacterized protein n=2 Tax=Franzmannia pantelleriensis TaxID=48727 RepID=A0A1G9XH78_9GAMM|nr:hypothetical protein SAMN05192555_1362 [Halomonas pantelleriensis]
MWALVDDEVISHHIIKASDSSPIFGSELSKRLNLEPRLVRFCPVSTEAG